MKHSSFLLSCALLFSSSLFCMEIDEVNDDQKEESEERWAAIRDGFQNLREKYLTPKVIHALGITSITIGAASAYYTFPESGSEWVRCLIECYDHTNFGVTRLICENHPEGCEEFYSKMYKEPYSIATLFLSCVLSPYLVYLGRRW